MNSNWFRSALVSASLTVSVAMGLVACGLPQPRPADDVQLDAQFNAAFGVPGSVPLDPPVKYGVVGRALTGVFGDPALRPKMVRPPPAVPNPRIEPIPRAPRYGIYAWQPSAWEWNGMQFVWVLGRWVQPHPNLTWQGGHWTTDIMGAYVWITGGWV